MKLLLVLSLKQDTFFKKAIKHILENKMKASEVLIDS